MATTTKSDETKTNVTPDELVDDAIKMRNMLFLTLGKKIRDDLTTGPTRYGAAVQNIILYNKMIHDWGFRTHEQPVVEQTREVLHTAHAMIANFHDTSFARRMDVDAEKWANTIVELTFALGGLHAFVQRYPVTPSPSASSLYVPERETLVTILPRRYKSVSPADKKPSS